MNFNVKLKCHKSEGKTKKLASPAGLTKCMYGEYYSGAYNATRWYRGATENVYAISFEKHRKKSERFGKNGNKLKKARITPAKWVCYYYIIPVELLKLMNKHLVQCTRTWYLEDL